MKNNRNNNIQENNPSLEKNSQVKTQDQIEKNASAKDLEKGSSYDRDIKKRK